MNLYIRIRKTEKAVSTNDTHVLIHEHIYLTKQYNNYHIYTVGPFKDCLFWQCLCRQFSSTSRQKCSWNQQYHRINQIGLTQFTTHIKCEPQCEDEGQRIWHTRQDRSKIDMVHTTGQERQDECGNRLTCIYLHNLQKLLPCQVIGFVYRIPSLAC